MGSRWAGHRGLFRATVHYISYAFITSQTHAAYDVGFQTPDCRHKVQELQTINVKSSEPLEIIASLNQKPVPFTPLAIRVSY